MPQNSVQDVQNPNRELVLKVISQMREKRRSYSQIGELLDMSKSEVYMVLKNQWYPKNPDVESRILNKIRGLGHDLL